MLLEMTCPAILSLAMASSIIVGLDKTKYLHPRGSRSHRISDSARCWRGFGPVIFIREVVVTISPERGGPCEGSNSVARGGPSLGRLLAHP